MGGHHLLLGELKDIVTGRLIPDTHDERYRQKIARILMNQSSFKKDEISTRRELIVGTDPKKAVVFLDFVIHLENRMVMIVKYGPGSIVTRHQPALAAARLVAPYRVPIVVVSNGREADVLDGETGRVTGRGFRAIPHRETVMENISEFSFRPVTPSQAAMASRLIYAYEVDGSCPCDDGICRLPAQNTEDHHDGKQQ